VAESSLSHWETYWKSAPEALPHPEIIEQIQKVITVKDSAVLEIGAGTGADSIELAKLGAKCTILDYSAEALKVARRNARNAGVEISLIEANAEKIPLPDESFDIVFSQGLVEHFKDPDRIVSEHFRLAKREGFILIDVPQKYNLYTLKKAKHIRQGTWFAGWETQFSAKRLKRIFDERKLTIIGVYGRGIPSFLQLIENLGHAGERRIGRPYLGSNASRSWLALWGEVNRRIAPYIAVCVGVVGRK
jgi:ubiquinone/menaquinone biosynthesis C-methylase UbiE